MNINKPQTFGIYVREELSEANMPQQIATVRSYLLKFNFEPSEIKIYTENERGSRTAFKELMQDLTSARISSVACWRADRLDNIFDDLQETIKFLSIIEQSSGRFIAVANSFDSGDLDSSTYTSLLKLIQSSKEQLRRERVRLGLLDAKENGRSIGRPSGGYEAQVLELRTEGKSIRGISGILRIPASTVQSILERKTQPQV